MTPHMPQFWLSVFVSTQVPLQSVVPSPQMQLPPKQVFPPEHALPHMPQFWLSVVVLVQTPLHEVWPGGQVHAPFTHEEPPPH
jgi:hypothetical protein